MRMAMAAGLVLAVMAGGHALAEGPVGLWKTAEGDDGRFLHVRIAPCVEDTGLLCGTVDGAFGGADAATIGRALIWDMAPDGPQRWDGGKVWAADEDEVYSAKMAMAGADTLTLSGCILGGLICRGQDWTRVVE
ncbi:MAG: DUF2147 domain-containing protein [Pseudomonadota bacterium]